jgi:hypothetical protein
MNTCKWGGCSNAALAPEAPFCSEHIDAVTAVVNESTRLMNERTAQQRKALVPASHITLWSRPGRWVPWVLFLIWLGLTALQPMLLLWWLIFVPIAWIGHQFGMNNTGKGGRDSYAVGQPSQPMSQPIQQPWSQSEITQRLREHGWGS